MMNEDQARAIAQLRIAGYAVVIWNPKELRGVDPGTVEAQSVERGNDIIDSLAELPDCAGGVHSWSDADGKLPPDTPCEHCGELYGNPA
jgi:hypothetical protein